MQLWRLGPHCFASAQVAFLVMLVILGLQTIIYPAGPMLLAVLAAAMELGGCKPSALSTNLLCAFAGCSP